MKILSYSPSIEVYVAHKGKDKEEYYDVSEDVVSCNVTRSVDAPSQFKVSLVNPGWKYNGLFEPMDKIVIFASKGKVRQQLLTGYITQVSRWTLYQADFEMSGYDTMYRIQKLYFDDGLRASKEAMFKGGSGIDEGGWRAAASMLVNIGGWPADQIGIKESIPGSVVEWVTKLYHAQREDIEGLQAVQDEFYKLIQNAGPTVAPGGASSDSGSGAVVGGIVSDGPISSKQQALLRAAESVGFVGAGWCAKWVSLVFDRAGFGYPGGNANDMCDAWCHSQNKADLKPGMIVACHPSGGTGSHYGHIGIYIGNGNVRHNGASLRTDTLDAWINLYGPNGPHRGGPVKWGWMMGNDLSA